MNGQWNTLLTPILAIALLSGCATPPEVRELAEMTAANVGALRMQIDILGQESRKLADNRADNISQLHAANQRGRASYNYDIALTKKSGGSANLALIGPIETWGAEVAKLFDAAESAQAERKAEILATQTKLDTKSKALAQIASSLAEIAKEESAADRVQFLAGFAKTLKSEIDKQLDQGTESAKAAKALLDGMSNTND